MGWQLPFSFFIWFSSAKDVESTIKLGSAITCSSSVGVASFSVLSSDKAIGEVALSDDSSFVKTVDGFSTSTIFDLIGVTHG